MNNKILVNESLCVGCGLCAKDCVAGNIKIENSKAHIISNKCIHCGHCEAICPKGAVYITGFSDIPEEFEECTRIDPDELLRALKSRRTIRQFTDEPVSEDDFEHIIEAARFTPTGGNAQDVSFIVLDKKKEQFEAVAVKHFKKLLGAGKFLSPAFRNMDIDENFFFKKAPLVILVVSTNKVNASLVAENMAIMAESCGLGVLFSGFFTAVANLSRTIRVQLHLNPGKKVITTLVIGHPDVKYHRTVRRNPADIKYI